MTSLDVLATVAEGGALTVVALAAAARDRALSALVVDINHYKSTSDVVSAARQIGKDVVITLVDPAGPADARTVVRLKAVRLENFKGADVIRERPGGRGPCNRDGPRAPRQARPGAFP